LIYIKILVDPLLTKELGHRKSEYQYYTDMAKDNVDNVKKFKYQTPKTRREKEKAKKERKRLEKESSTPLPIKSSSNRKNLDQDSPTPIPTKSITDVNDSPKEMEADDRLKNALSYSTSSVFEGFNISAIDMKFDELLDKSNRDSTEQSQQPPEIHNTATPDASLKLDEPQPTENILDMDEKLGEPHDTLTYEEMIATATTSPEPPVTSNPVHQQTVPPEYSPLNTEPDQVKKGATLDIVNATLEALVKEFANMRKEVRATQTAQGEVTQKLYIME
jgi:hypothetical protein